MAPAQQPAEAPNRGNPARPAHVCVIGGGPAGLMAAEVLAKASLQVTVFDAMPSVGRKFLLAGVGGMNITHSEPRSPFLARYGQRGAALTPIIDAFDAAGAAPQAAGVATDNLLVMDDAGAHYHPGQSATLRMGPKNILAAFGTLHPATAKAFDLDGNVVAAEIFPTRIVSTRTHHPPNSHSLLMHHSVHSA